MTSNPADGASPRASGAVARSQALQIGDVTIGAASPATIVSIVAPTELGDFDENYAVERARLLARNRAVDIVELRIDHLRDVATPNRAAEVVRMVTGALHDKPLLVTFRSAREGGRADLDDAAYAALYRSVLDVRVARIMDLEFARINYLPVTTLLKDARAVGVVIVVSYHDLTGTPMADEIVAILRRMQSTDADILKIALMPHDPADILALLGATWTMVREHANRPIITMAMGGLGVASRLAGNTFGSAATFGSDGVSSAPGQIDVELLRRVLDATASP